MRKSPPRHPWAKLTPEERAKRQAALDAQNERVSEWLAEYRAEHDRKHPRDPRTGRYVSKRRRHLRAA